MVSLKFKIKINYINKINQNETNSQRENKRVKWIIESINNNTDIGKEIREKYYELWGKKIKSVKKTNLRNKHYDIKIIHEDGSVAHCEEKGTNTKRNINELSRPWDNAVQIYNGPAKQFIEFVDPYIDLWYKDIICDKDFREKYDILEEIPTINEWKKYDLFIQDNPKTKFGIEMKNKFRNKNGKRSSLNGTACNFDKEDYRQRVIPKYIEIFKNSEELKIKTKKLIQEKLNNVLEEKDCWLQTTGIEPNINFKWYKKTESPKITSIKIDDTKKDIVFVCDIEKNKNKNIKKIECILRFGKGCGFSNLRCDIKLK